jgi:hypothetical protein
LGTEGVPHGEAEQRAHGAVLVAHGVATNRMHRQVGQWWLTDEVATDRRNGPPPRHKEALLLTPSPVSSRPGRCSWCGRDVDILDDQGRCVRCVTEAVGRASALDSFDHGAVLCLAAGLDELQLRHAQIMVVDEAEGALLHDFVVRRREPDGGFAWHVPSSFLSDAT